MYSVYVIFDPPYRYGVDMHYVLTRLFHHHDTRPLYFEHSNIIWSLLFACWRRIMSTVYITLQTD